MSRLRYNFIGGKIDDNPLTSGTATINSTALAAFPAVVSPDYIVASLDPDGIWGEPEIVWITAHTTTATSATILRAQEGTVARAHPNDTYWVSAPTAEDFRLSENSAKLYLASNYI